MAPPKALAQIGQPEDPCREPYDAKDFLGLQKCCEEHTHGDQDEMKECMGPRPGQLAQVSQTEDPCGGLHEQDLKDCCSHAPTKDEEKKCNEPRPHQLAQVRDHGEDDPCSGKHGDDRDHCCHENAHNDQELFGCLNH